MRREFRIGKKFQDRSRQRFAIARLYEQTVLPVLDNFWNIAHFCRDDGAPAGERFTQNDRRRLSVQGRNHHHVARGINVGRVPAVSGHDDFLGQSGAIDGIPYIDAALQQTRALAHYDKACIGTFR